MSNIPESPDPSHGHEGANCKKQVPEQISHNKALPLSLSLYIYIYIYEYIPLLLPLSSYLI